MNAPLAPELKPSRVYWTEFDRVTYSQVGWSADDVDAIRKNLDRKLKLLGIVKGQVIVPASHLLESELAREVVLEHPTLFSSGILVPALRSDFASCTAFLEMKAADLDYSEADLYKGSEQRDIAQLVDGTAHIERWDVRETNDWFKERLLADLKDEQSLLRSCLRTRNLSISNSFQEYVRRIDNPSRSDVYRLAKQAGGVPLWDVLCNYTDFLYYLSGARAVQSEGVLPQENLVDFSFTDLAAHRTRLSEWEVFFKLFVDILKADTSTHFPVDFLDALTIEDIIELRQATTSHQFVEKYNVIQKTTKDGLALHDPARLVMLMEELEEFEHELHRSFQNALEGELPAYLRRKRREAATSFLHSIASLLIPYYDIVGSARDIVVSGLRFAGRRNIAESIDGRIRDGIGACNTLLDQRLADQPVLLAFIDKLKERYAGKLDVVT